MVVHKILLASPDIDVFLQLDGIFALRNNIEVLLARTECQLLSRTETEKPDLILVDYDMSRRDGEPLYRQIRAALSFSDIPIIPVVSAEDIESLKDSGPEGEEYLCKPIDPQKFLRTISRYLCSDRRSAPRVPSRLRINYGVEGRDVLTDYSVNLSSGGVFIETADVLPADTPLFLEFTLPESDRTIRCKGRVAWVNHPEKILSPHLPPGMGVQFLDFVLQEVLSLREVLKKEALHPSW
ncbi:TIGR02266 family protein [Desulfuromonas sp. TF]|uniref:TIGR02266 family protein n=1 Tax=Desulfuromonas sp. TF TaxID=1232410 RepID=UPI0004289A94|nr:TIGR02266 family protein [Desulfuromonas sp. TF]